MPDTVGLSAILEIVARLSASHALKPVGHIVEHYRTNPAPVPAGGRTVVYPAPNFDGITESDEEPDNDDAVRETATIRVETTIDPGDDPPDVALDPYKTWIVSALLPTEVGMVDRTLGGRVKQLRRQMRVIMTDEHGRPTGVQIMQFEVMLDVHESDPTVSV